MATITSSSFITFLLLPRFSPPLQLLLLLLAVVNSFL
jgi:hypothetical protein